MSAARSSRAAHPAEPPPTRRSTAEPPRNALYRSPDEQPTGHFDRPPERIRVIELLLGVIGVGIEFSDGSEP